MHSICTCDVHFLSALVSLESTPRMLCSILNRFFFSTSYINLSQRLESVLSDEIIMHSGT